MKKLPYLMAILLLSSFAYAGIDIIQQYGGTPGGDVALGYNNNTKFIAFNMTPTITAGLGNVTLSMRIYGSLPAGGIKLMLFNATESKPDTFMANSTEILSTSSFTTSYVERNISFATGPTVTSGKRYAIAAWANWTPDATNYIGVQSIDLSSIGHGINSSNNGYNWLPASTWFPVFTSYNTTQSGGGGIASFVDPTPGDGSTSNTQQTLNVSCSDSGRVWLYFDQNTDPRNPVLRNSTSNSWPTNATVVGKYYYKAQCFNSTTGFSPNTTTRTWTFDNSSPTLTLNPSNEFQTNNFSANFQYDDIFILNLTMNDETGLFGFRVNITQPNGTSRFNMTNLTLNNLTVYNLSRVINISTWPNNTEYNIEVIVADSHTSMAIPEYDKKFKLDGWQFGTPEGNLITISADSPGLFEANKLSDRYELGANFLVGGKKKFTLECDSDLYYLPMSKYKGHFVCWAGSGGNWIDFEGVDEAPTITKINDKKFTIEYQDLKDANFKSLGGLNEINKTYKWFRGAFSHIAPLALTQQNVTLTLNMTKNGSINTINAGLYYNGSYYNPTKTTTTNYIWFSATVPVPLVTVAENVTYFWNVSVTQNNPETIKNLSNSSIRFQHEVAPFGIDLCTTYTTRALNFSIFEENNRTPLNVSVFANFNITQDQISYRGVSFSDANTANFSLCITPPNSTFLLDGYIQYTGSGAITERYYIINLTVNSTTQNVYMYNFAQDTGLSRLTLEVDNSILQKYPGVIVKMQRYYPQNNSYVTVQIDRSDELAQAVFWVYQSYVDYKFVFEKDGSTLYISNPLKFLCLSTTECTQIFILPDTSALDEYEGMSASLTHNNLTGIITLTWSDTNNVVQNVRLLVQKQLPTGSQTLCDQTVGSTSGTMNCNISNHYGLITARAFRSASPWDTFSSLTIEKILNQINQLTGTEAGDINAFGGFGSFFLVLTFGAFGALGGSVGLIIGTIIGMVVSLFLGIFSYITLGAVLFALFMGLLLIFLLKGRNR